MKVLKNILIGFGVVFVGIIALIIFLSTDSSRFKETHADFIDQFLEDYSQHWDVADVHSRVTNDLLIQIRSAQGKNALSVFESLGVIESTSDLEIGNYYSGTSGKSGEFSLKAVFSNGLALINIIVNEEDGDVRVNGLHITPSGEIHPALTEHEA